MSAAPRLTDRTVTPGETVSGKNVPANVELTIDRGGIVEASSFQLFDTIYVNAGGMLSQSVLSGTAVFNSGSVVSCLLEAGGSLLVNLGGTSEDTQVRTGGIETIVGNSVSATVQSGGVQLISGAAQDAVVTAGGVQEVTLGTASDTEVLSGGQEVVSGSGLGTAVLTTVFGGGIAMVQNALFRDGEIAAGGQLMMQAGGTIDSTDVQSGGLLFVLPESSEDFVDTQVQAGGTLVLLGGAGDQGLVVNSGAFILSATVDVTSSVLPGAEGYVEAEGNDPIGTTLGANERQEVFSGGVASHTVIADGEQLVDPHGLAQNTVVSSGFGQIITPDGTATGTVLKGAGYQFVSGGVASDTTISSGGAQFVYGGGTASSSTIGTGGSATLEGRSNLPAALAIGAVVSGGSQVASAYSLAEQTTLEAGGTLTVAGEGSATGATISAGGVVQIAGGTATDLVLISGGTIDVTWLAYVAGGSATLNSKDVLTVSEGSHQLNLQLAGSYSGETFALSPDSGGHTDITIAGGSALPPSADLDFHFHHG